MSKRSKKLVLALITLSACNPDEAVFKKAGNIEEKPLSTLLSAPGSTQQAEAKNAATVHYVMKVTSASGAAVCEGEATVKISTEFQLSFPKAEIDCLSLKVNLAKALNTGDGFGGTAAENNANISHDGQVFALKKLANAEFEPARPMLIGPVIQDPSSFKNFRRTTQHTLVGTNPMTGEALKGSGTFTVEVLEPRTTYKNKFIDEPFDDVMHWTMTTSGFAGIPAQTGLVFQKWEWLWNTRPIMIPKISITGRLSDFITGEDSDKTDALLGDLQIDLVVKDYQIEKD